MFWPLLCTLARTFLIEIFWPLLCTLARSIPIEMFWPLPCALARTIPIEMFWSLLCTLARTIPSEIFWPLLCTLARTIPTEMFWPLLCTLARTIPIEIFFPILCTLARARPIARFWPLLPSAAWADPIQTSHEMLLRTSMIPAHPMKRVRGCQLVYHNERIILHACFLFSHRIKLRYGTSLPLTHRSADVDPLQNETSSQMKSDISRTCYSRIYIVCPMFLPNNSIAATPSFLCIVITFVIEDF